MEAKQILEIMDYLWFERRIFQNKPEFMHRKKDESGEKSTVVQNLGIRSYSDHCIAVDFDAGSPRSVITKPKLQKIPSGEEVLFEHSFAGREKKREKPQYGRGGMSRSLSALEFEELKGFMDLGFEKNPSIVSIVPALQKWRKTDGDEEVIGERKGGVSRPYLSEAWGDLSTVMNLRIPYGKNEMDMKDHLKVWAHVVASTVR